MIVSGLLILIHLDNAVHFSVKAKSENGSTQFFWGKDASGDTLRFRKVNEKKTDIITRQSIFKARATGVLQGEELQANWFPYSQRFGGYVVVNEKLPNYVVPDLTDFKLKPYVS
ncbi:54S ribosomal protein L27, mitochondrial-like isoform X2 [Actinidia eriantha]|uniref:54S ribosomal protein L27, mitochondrial-like isoform X2 n=1 Tax=Actinidia eriantha TaxID=165200 RepID=UPI00258B1871|nr:54S ribosomal protein L27, mitochondrial-like isoform X2 [Actinidia eriantha]